MGNHNRRAKAACKGPITQALARAQRPDYVGKTTGTTDQMVKTTDRATFERLQAKPQAPQGGKKLERSLKKARQRAASAPQLSSRPRLSLFRSYARVLAPAVQRAPTQKASNSASPRQSTTSWATIAARPKSPEKRPLARSQSASTVRIFSPIPVSTPKPGTSYASALKK